MWCRMLKMRSVLDDFAQGQGQNDHWSTNLSDHSHVLLSVVRDQRYDRISISIVLLLQNLPFPTTSSFWSDYFLINLIFSRNNFINKLIIPMHILFTDWCTLRSGRSNTLFGRTILFQSKTELIKYSAYCIVFIWIATMKLLILCFLTSATLVVSAARAPYRWLY